MNNIYLTTDTHFHNGTMIRAQEMAKITGEEYMKKEKCPWCGKALSFFGNNIVQCMVCDYERKE